MPLGLCLPRALCVGFTSLVAAYGDNPDDWVPTSLAQLGGLDLVYGDIGEGMPAAWWEKEIVEPITGLDQSYGTLFKGFHWFREKCWRVGIGEREPEDIVSAFRRADMVIEKFAKNIECTTGLERKVMHCISEAIQEMEEIQ